MNKNKAEMDSNESVSALFLFPTSDPYVMIEEQSPGYIRYRNLSGRRWEVIGECDYRGDCLVGAVNPLLGHRSTRLDVPVTPEFNTCCGKDIFSYVELESVITDGS